MPDLDSEALDFRAASESFVPCDLIGKDRERDFPDAWIQAGRLAGPPRIARLRPRTHDDRWAGVSGRGEADTRREGRLASQARIV